MLQWLFGIDGRTIEAGSEWTTDLNLGVLLGHDPVGRDRLLRAADLSMKVPSFGDVIWNRCTGVACCFSLLKFHPSGCGK